MSLKRSASETLAQIGAYLSQPDIEGRFGRAAASHLVLTLPLSSAKATPLIRDNVTDAEWVEVHIDTPDKLRQYLAFEGSPERPPGLISKAWRDANACQGMNARKNLAGLAALVWAMGAEHEELYVKLTKVLEEFTYYGKPGLVLICEELGIHWGSLDNDEWKLIPGDDEPKRASEVVA